MFIVGTIILTLIYTGIFYKFFKDIPNISTFICLILGLGSTLYGIGSFSDEFYIPMLSWIFIGIGLFLLWCVFDGTYKNYKIEKNTAEVIERFVTGIVKTKNSKTNIKTVNNNVTSSEEYHTVIKLDEPDAYDNFINFYDYSTFMTVSEGERVNLKNIRKLDENKNVLDSTYWIV